MSLFPHFHPEPKKPSENKPQPEPTPQQPAGETQPEPSEFGALNEVEGFEAAPEEAAPEPAESQPEEAKAGPGAETLFEKVEDALKDAAERLEEITSPGYASSQEHLWDELGRIDRLVHAQTQHWLLTIAEDKDQDLWGMAHVSRKEVDRFLRAEFTPSYRFSNEAEAPLRDFWYEEENRSRAIAERVEHTHPPIVLRLERLKDLFELTRLQLDALLVCLLPQLDARYRRLYGYLEDDALRTRPSVELVLEILHPLIHSTREGRALFDPRGPLLANGLLVLGSGPQGDESLQVRPVSVDDRIVDYLLDRPALDARLVGVVTEGGGPLTAGDLVVGEKLRTQISEMAEWWRRRSMPAEIRPAEELRGAEPERPVKRREATFFLYGPYGSPSQKVARVICGAGLPPTPLLEADCAAALHSPYGFAAVVQLCFREALLRGAALHWRGCEILLQPDAEPSIKAALAAHWEALLAAAERCRWLTFLSSAVSWDPAGRFHQHPFLRLALPVPAFDIREQLWLAHLPALDHLAGENISREALASLLANSFQLTEGQVIDSAATALELAAARDPLHPRLTTDDLFEGCRRQSGRGLTSLARRLEARSGLTFEDLKLPAAGARQLKELRQRIANRDRLMTELGLEQRIPLSRGLVVLFTGSSGTGKTMAAELLAAEMHVDLYRVDLSAVVNKYIGETEKNLARLFDEAEEMNACLLMDEADALFGKRGEVKDASDRFANMQVNYLLQRIESYQGLVILATNLRQNMDVAFMRRIQCIIEFSAPGAPERFQIWMGMFPDPAKMGRPDEKEIGRLAEQFELTGAQIRNAVLSAAYMALADTPRGQKPVMTIRHLVLSVASELVKIGKPAMRGIFGSEYYKYIEEQAAEDARQNQADDARQNQAGEARQNQAGDARQNQAGDARQNQGEQNAADQGQ